MRIAVIGSGYVGLVSGVCLSSIGHHVICVDNDLQKIKTLKKGRLPIYEPGLLELMHQGVAQKRLSFTASIGEATKKSDVIFLAVPTPRRANGDADLTFIEKVARQIAQHMDSYKLIVEKSTVPAETGMKIRHTIHLNLRPKHKKGNKILLDFDVAANPEFLKEGSAVYDFMHPDRIVVGVETPKAAKILREIYKPLKPLMLVTNIASAEMIKHASNSFLSMKISFINATAQICDRVGADVLKVAQGMGLDKRIGHQFLQSGIGYGGSCFPKDVDAFIHVSEKSGYDFSLLKEARRINDNQRLWFVRYVEEKLWNIKEKTIGVWGLAFKPHTDDIRNAPALDIINRLLAEGAHIRAFDPQAMSHARKVLKRVVFCRDAYAVAEGCDCLLLLTEWPEFRDINFVQMRDVMRQAVIFDGRNFLDGSHLKKIGFEYFGIGRGKS